jgi:hypothetical protein
MMATAASGQVPLMVSRPTYERMMKIKADLKADKGREVTNLELGEALVELWEKLGEAIDRG